jgi:hypothetical protein
VNRIIIARNRLHEARGLPAVLDAAYDAFETIRSVLREHDNPAEAMFVSFVMSATAAANARDAIGFAPSLPPHRLVRAYAPGDNPQPEVSAGELAGAVAGLSQLIADKLAQAASSVPGIRDRAACADACQDASDIHVLLTGTGP